MIRATFYIRDGKTVGFEVSGHSGSAQKGYDIICAAVSSAVYMAVNTVTDVIDCDVKVDEHDGYMKAMLTGTKSAARDVFDGLKLHLTQLSENYPDNIRITTEV